MNNNHYEQMNNLELNDLLAAMVDSCTAAGVPMILEDAEAIRQILKNRIEWKNRLDARALLNKRNAILYKQKARDVVMFGLTLESQ